MALIKLVGKTFVVCQKSVKVFFCVGFVVYSSTIRELFTDVYIFNPPHY